jgi:transcriptional regulator with XRE-family HTH domain
MNDQDYIRQRIRQARKELHLRQRDVGKEIGASIANVSNIETGRLGVKADKLAEIARVLQRPITWFYPPDLLLTEDGLDEHIEIIAYELEQLESVAKQLEWPGRAVAARRVERLKELVLGMIRAEYQDIQEMRKFESVE